MGADSRGAATVAINGGLVGRQQLLHGSLPGVRARVLPGRVSQSAVLHRMSLGKTLPKGVKQRCRDDQGADVIVAENFESSLRKLQEAPQ